MYQKKYNKRYHPASRNDWALPSAFIYSRNNCTSVGQGYPGEMRLKLPGWELKIYLIFLLSGASTCKEVVEKEAPQPTAEIEDRTNRGVTPKGSQNKIIHLGVMSTCSS